MPDLRRKLPPANSLVIFEAAARLLSFTAAARELLVTQAAVSRQIGILETHLGVGLFERRHRSVRLTPEGEQLFSAVRIGLDHIANTAMTIRRTTAPTQVTVTTTMAFGSFWLMPRLHRFRELHPETQVRLVASDRHIDPGTSGVDVAVRYGDGNWTGFATTHLFEEEVFPVCSPSYLSQHPELRSAADLPEQILLRMEPAHQSWIDWDSWMRELGIPSPRVWRGPQFNAYTILVQAAIAGQGIALGWRHMVEDPLASGSLVRPVDASLKAGGSYYVLLPERHLRNTESMVLRDWILREARAPTGQ